MKAATPSTPPPHGVLVLLTQGFPYGHSEPFVADELPYLAQRFERVIVATTAAANKTMRTLPANAEVHHLDERLEWHSLMDRACFSECIRVLRRHPACIKVAVKSWLRSKGYASQLSLLLEQTIQKDRPAVLYAYWMSDLALAAVHTAGKRHLIKTISRAHGWDVYAERHPHHYLPFRSHLAKHLDRAFPISADGLRVLQGYGYKQVQLARLGVAQVREEAPMDQDETILVSISSLIPLKRIGKLVDMLAKLGKDAPSWIHFGSGPQSEDLHQKARDLGVQVKWAGQIDNHALRAWLHAHASRALLINMSRFEGIPVSMMEAMSVGIPCIGPAVGGIEEIIEDGRNGFLLRRDAVVEDGVRFVRQFLAKSKDERTAMRQAAFATWNSRYNAEQNFSKLAATLQELIR